MTSPLYTHRAIAAPAAVIDTVRAWFTYLREQSAPTLSRAISVSGQEPAHAFLGFGMVGATFATYLQDPAAMRAAMQAKKSRAPAFPNLSPDTFDVPSEQDIADVLAKCYVSEQTDIGAVLADLGMQFIKASFPGPLPLLPPDDIAAP